MTQPRLFLPVVLAVLVAAPFRAEAQSTSRPDSVVVHLSQYQVRWDRVDSLRKLQQMYPQWLERAKAAGHIVNREVWIHQQGDEWNVAIAQTFASWQKWANQEPGWGTRIFALVEPDSAKRNAFTRANSWVFEGAPHKDNIYRKVAP